MPFTKLSCNLFISVLYIKYNISMKSIYKKADIFFIYIKGLRKMGDKRCLKAAE